MRYYSDVLKKFFDSEEECNEAEFEAKRITEEKKKQEEAENVARKQASENYNAAIKAYKEKAVEIEQEIAEIKEEARLEIKECRDELNKFYSEKVNPAKEEYAKYAKSDVKKISDLEDFIKALLYII